MKTVKKAKPGLVVKKLDWNLLAKDMLDGLFLSQQRPGTFVASPDYHPGFDHNDRDTRAVKEFMQGLDFSIIFNATPCRMTKHVCFI